MAKKRGIIQRLKPYFFGGFLAKIKLKKLSLKDKCYNDVKEFAKTMFLNLDLNGNRISFPTIAQNIGTKFKRLVNAETIRNWCKADKWDNYASKIIQQAEKVVFEGEKNEEEKVAFLADLIRVNDSMWRKAVNIVNQILKEKNIDIKDAMFLLKFTSDNKIKFEQLKLDLLTKKIELERNQILVDELKKTRINDSNTGEFLNKFITAIESEDD